MENVFCRLLRTLRLLARLGGNIQLSVDLTVNEYAPPVVGVPEITPEEFMFSPGGKEPEAILYTIGACPPDICIWIEYPCPTVPEGSGELEVMLRGKQGGAVTGGGAATEGGSVTGGGAVTGGGGG